MSNDLDDDRNAYWMNLNLIKDSPSVEDSQQVASSRAVGYSKEPKLDTDDVLFCCETEVDWLRDWIKSNMSMLIYNSLQSLTLTLVLEVGYEQGEWEQQ